MTKQEMNQLYKILVRIGVRELAVNIWKSVKTDATLDRSLRGNGNKAKRRMGMVCVPFRCNCEWSPCQHEHLYEQGAVEWFYPND